MYYPTSEKKGADQLRGYREADRSAYLFSPMQIVDFRMRRLIFSFQAFVVLLLRYLQTSVQSAYEGGDLEGTGRGFCIPDICPAGCCPGDPDKYVRAGGTVNKIPTKRLEFLSKHY